MKIQQVQERPTERGPADWFTGTVWFDELAIAPRPSGLRVHRVSFEPGARTKWHTHPLGQVLHGVAGVGLVGFENAPAQRLLPGDTILIAPGERHWHGAASGHLFTHLAIQEADAGGGEADWSEPVSDAEYQKAASGITRSI